MNKQEQSVESAIACPECGASWKDGLTCQDAFHRMLAWESENSSLWEVHFLTVLSYHLQHPSMYAPAGLNYAKGLLVDHLENDISPLEMRRRSRGTVDSGKRKWKITGTPASHGSYKYPPAWTMTAVDVINAGEAAYCDSVRAWGRSILHSLRVSGNLAADE